MKTDGAWEAEGEARAVRWRMPVGLAVLLGAVCLGAALRLWLLAHQERAFHAVDGLFDALAWNLATGRGFTLDGSTPSAHVAPLYPAVLAGFYRLVGHRPDLVPALHIVFDADAAACVFLLGTRMFGARVGGIAAAAVFLYPAYWTYDLRIRSESLLTLLLCGWALAAVAAHRGGRIPAYAVSGALAGLAALCKPVVIPIALLLALAGLLPPRPRRPGLAGIGVYVLCAVLVVLPWTVRNVHAFGVLLPVSTGAGVGLWMGSDPVSGGSWPMPPVVESQIWERAEITPLAYPHVMYEVPVDRMLAQRGWARIRQAPGRYLGLTVRRIFDLWIGNRLYLFNSEAGFLDGVRRDLHERGAGVAAYSLVKRFVVVPVALGLAAAAAWRFRARWRDLLPLYAFPMGLTLAYVPFCVESGRYVLPVLPCVGLLAVAVLAHDGPTAADPVPENPSDAREAA